MLFLPEIPRDFQPLQDFRKNGSTPLSTSSIFIIREIQQKQDWISSSNEENGEDKLAYVGKYSRSDKIMLIHCAPCLLDHVSASKAGDSRFESSAGQLEPIPLAWKCLPECRRLPTQRFAESQIRFATVANRAMLNREPQSAMSGLAMRSAL